MGKIGLHRAQSWRVLTLFARGDLALKKARKLAINRAGKPVLVPFAPQAEAESKRAFTKNIIPSPRSFTMFRPPFMLKSSDFRGENFGKWRGSCAGFGHVAGWEFGSLGGFCLSL